jgi:hypothetical protein
MPSETSGSRIGPGYLPPVVFEGKRYEEVMNGELIGLEQRTGYMAIYDEVSGARLHVIKIYESMHDPDIEADVQDVFFTVFEMIPDKREILIGDERGERYAYGIDDGSVRGVP